MMVSSGAYERNEGDGKGDSILSGFGSSSGSSSDETSEQEELLDELSRQMAEHMLQEEDMAKVAHYNKLKAARSQHNTFFQYQWSDMYGKEKEVKEYEEGSTKAGFGGGAVPDGSGLRALYLGKSGSRNGSVGGTGVFIPQAATNTQPSRQPRKKPGRCSRVLIPERVLHSLKQHHEKRNEQAHPTAMFQAHHSQLGLLQLQQQQQETPNKTLENNNKNENNEDDGYAELHLPQEWTY